MTNYEEEYPQWNDWPWQMRNRVFNAQQLSKWIPVSDELRSEIESCTVRFRMAATPYFLSLIDPDDPDDPIRKQCIVSSKELELCPGDMHDPLNEGGSSVTPHIVHRYPDRVLLLVTTQCAMYCRHCTRRRIVGERDCSPTIEELDKELDYIRAHKEVRDVLISGGDPLTLPTDRLEAIIKRLREIEHVDIIRIGTRVPCVLPMRIDDELVSMLKKYHPLWMNIQFNHVRELTPKSEEACRKLADAGIPLGNQSVLLNGINDDAETMKALLLRLVHNRIRPYYLYQCDLAEGIGHFRTTVDKGIDIIHQLQGRISGFAVPKYVIDAPGGGGKVPINYEYVKEVDGNKIVFENYEGGLYSYLQPGGEKNDG